MDAFPWAITCPEHGEALMPVTQVNFTATVMCRVYVCPFSGAIIVKRSDHVQMKYSLAQLAHWPQFNPDDPETAVM